MTERCRTIKGVHIPGCMGCAVYGHSRCTCNDPKSLAEEIEALKAKMAKYERREREREAANSRANADYLRERAKTEGKPTPHCCGESGFGQSWSDVCPACEDQAKGAR